MTRQVREREREREGNRRNEKQKGKRKLCRSFDNQLSVVSKRVTHILSGYYFFIPTTEAGK
jgi:hypothetical protein